MSASTEPTATPASAPCPLAVVMITLNEAHNLPGALKNLEGFASEVLILDSFSSDATVDIALAGGAQVFQRRFRSFGDQWDFAVNALPIGAPWTMKLDPDERISDPLKDQIRAALARGEADAFEVRRRLWFMGRPLPATQDILRVWRTGSCRFPPVLVNEHPVVTGATARLSGALEHHDSPNLHHWVEKQNAYTTAEARSAVQALDLAAKPRLFGGGLERRMALKAWTRRSPLLPWAMFAYCLIVLGGWRAGRVGWAWASMRAFYYRLIQLKIQEMERVPYDESVSSQRPRTGAPDPRVAQLD